MSQRPGEPPPGWSDPRWQQPVQYPTGAAEPSSQATPARPPVGWGARTSNTAPANARPANPSTRTRYAALIALLAAAIAVSVLASALPRLHRGGTDSPAILRWVGGDGHAEWLYGGAEKEPMFIETAQYQGVSAFISSDIRLATGLGDPTLIGQHLWVYERSTVDGMPSEVLLSPDRGALLHYGTRSLTELLIFTPAKIALPDDPRPGQTWQQEGNYESSGTDARGSGKYRIEGKLGDAGGGCLLVSTTETLGTNPPVQRDVIRCPGRGVVADKQAGVEAKAEAPDGQGPKGSFNTTARPHTPSDRPLVQQLRYGDLPISPYAQAGVGATDTGMVIASQFSQDLISVHQGSKDAAQLLFTRHPGGMIRSLAGFGQIMVAGTTKRELVGYDVIGRRLWTTPTPDVVSEIIRLDDRRMVAATVTGAVLVLDIASGRQLWQQTLSQSTEVPLVVAERNGAPVVLAGVANGIVAFTDQGAQAWSVQLSDDVDLMAAVGDRLVVSDSEGRVFGLDLSDGALVWTKRRSADLYRQASPIGEAAVVFIGAGGATILSTRTGEQQGQLAGDFNLVQPIVRPAKGGAGAVALTEAGWVVFDTNGAALDQGTVPKGFGSESGLLRTDGHTVACGDGGYLLFWGVPTS